MKIYNKTKQAIITIRNCLYKPLNYINCKLSGVEFSGDLKVNGLLHLKNNGEICIGQKVRINSSRENNINFNGDRTYLCASNGKIVIGNEVGISNTVIYSENKIVIDDGVFLGNGCKIYDTDFHPLETKYRNGAFRDDSHTKTAPIYIGKNAFIGTGVYILKGVSIGKNSIVGAGAVVTKNIPDNEIWAGNPAHYIKRVNIT